jgi:hypothetical protein
MLSVKLSSSIIRWHTGNFPLDVPWYTGNSIHIDSENIQRQFNKLYTLRIEQSNIS